jgi:hypothetical protein
MALNVIEKAIYINAFRYENKEGPLNSAHDAKCILILYEGNNRCFKSYLRTVFFNDLFHVITRLLSVIYTSQNSLNN